MGDAAWREEWSRLVAERAAARERAVRSLASLAARARDPLGLKARLREHPYVAAGIAAGAGALLVNLLLGPGGSRASGDDAPRRTESPFAGALRDAAARAATPWLTQLLAQHLSRWFDLEGAAPTNGSDADA